MPKQSPIIPLKKLTEKEVPGIVAPLDIRNLRAFYEGAIACGQTKASMKLTKNPYTGGSDHFNDWNTGWLQAEVLVIRDIRLKQQQYPFLKETG